MSMLCVDKIVLTFKESFINDVICLDFKVPELKMYTLYADSDADVSERNRVKYIVYYNDNCASKLFTRTNTITICFE